MFKLGDHQVVVPSIGTDGQWISVKDWLPEKGGLYLVYAADRVSCEYYHVLSDGYTAFGTSETKEANITHWMPLPDPPKEE